MIESQWDAESSLYSVFDQDRNSTSVFSESNLSNNDPSPTIIKPEKSLENIEVLLVDDGKSKAEG